MLKQEEQTMVFVQQNLVADREISGDVGEDDHCLRRRLECSLQRDPIFLKSAFTCECREGVVVLRGHVGSFHEKQMAQELARKVNGVRVVVNRLIVDASQLTTGLNEVIPVRQHSSHSIN
jgi:osmotically-inducible protein OsmY